MKSSKGIYVALIGIVAGVLLLMVSLNGLYSTFDHARSMSRHADVSVTIPEAGVHCAVISDANGTAIFCYPYTWVVK